jgi:hydrogenase maturation protease
MIRGHGTLILGIGNVLLRDEGAGVHVVRQLASRLPPREDISILDGGTLSFALAEAIENASQLIVIDAAQLDAEPGATRVFLGAQMDDFVGGNRRCSVHEVSLIDLMAIAILTGKLPEKRALIGIQPHQIDWGDTPSPPVVAAIHQACNQTLQLIKTWHTC